MDDDSAPRPIDVIGAAQSDYSRLIALLYEQGYFGPEISITVDGREAASLSPVAAPAAVSQVVVSVTPGARFTFGAVAIAPAATGTAPTPEVATGAQASVSALRSATATHIEGWRQQGHAKAAVSRQNIIANHPNRQINADIRLDPGPQLRLGRLRIEGESAVREKRIREIAGWPSGAVFDPDTLDLVQTRLRRTGTFASTSLTEAETPNGKMRLEIVKIESPE
ncbi:MAG: hypothetical protein AAFY39_09285 [Pseudomonadota bacterium]